MKKNTPKREHLMERGTSVNRIGLCGTRMGDLPMDKRLNRPNWPESKERIVVTETLYDSGTQMNEI